MSNLGFGLRNIAIKNKGECEIKVRSRHALIFSFLAWTSVAILDIHKLGPGMHVVFLLSSSTEFHVLYSSLSTCVVLKEVSVITHAVLNNLKRLLVVMFLVLAGSRSLSLSNLGGLALAVLGLGIYTMGKDTSTGLRVETGKPL